jgi:hypothetical protein
MDIQDVIQAFVDGEPVDPVELERALADPDGRAYLIDLVVLRKLVKRSPIAASMAAAPVAGASVARAPRRTAGWLAAAAVVVAATAAGYFVGERSSDPREPAPHNATAPPATGDAASVDPAAPPPTPTVVIRFQPGVDWTERGGH